MTYYFCRNSDDVRRRLATEALYRMTTGDQGLQNELVMAHGLIPLFTYLFECGCNEVCFFAFFVCGIFCGFFVLIFVVIVCVGEGECHAGFG